MFPLSVAKCWRFRVRIVAFEVKGSHRHVLSVDISERVMLSDANFAQSWHSPGASGNLCKTSNKQLAMNFEEYRITISNLKGSPTALGMGTEC